MKSIEIYDTTLRDGGQDGEINFSLTDKLRIVRKLDELGVAYAEGGWPGSNETDRQFFEEVRALTLHTTRVAAFGSTRHPRKRADNDPNLQALIAAQPHAATIFGKTWDLHAREALKVENAVNVAMIGESVAHLKAALPEVLFDAEHFFDGFKANREFALACLRAAHEAGAGVLVLCDTNGGVLPHEIRAIVAAVAEALPEARLGIHTHNDSDTAVASSVEAVLAGCVHVQGTINGYGERAGNANLCSVIPNLELKCDCACLPEGRLEKLTTVSRFVSEVANLRPFLRQPYVGRAAFAHKGGVHVSAILKNPATYEHVPPASVGNQQRVLLSDLSGRANILEKAKRYGYELDKDDVIVHDLLADLKARESMGYEYSSAEASFELLFYRTMGWSRQYFRPMDFRVYDALHGDAVVSEATVKVKVRGMVEHTAAGGHGPLNALDKALRKAVERFYPCIREIRLADFKVRVLPGATQRGGGTASMVRVLIESADHAHRWITVGVSDNIIHASWNALVDALTYKLFKDDPQKWPHQAPEPPPA